MDKWTCPRCLKAGKSAAGKKPDETQSPSKVSRLTCVHCKVEKTREAFGEAYLEDLRPNHLSRRALCLDCREPTCNWCAVKCEVSLAESSRLVKGRTLTLCDRCRYPPCTFCQRTPRPQKRWYYDVENRKDWYCDKTRCQREAAQAQSSRKK